MRFRERGFPVTHTTCIPKISYNVAIWCIVVIATVGSMGFLIQSVPSFKNVETDISLDQWLESQDKISLQSIYANLGSAGAKAYGATIDGLLLYSAVPEGNEMPWTRIKDGALVFKTIFDRFNATHDQTMHLAIRKYISSQAILQNVSSPSGDLLPYGDGLSEPRFLPNGSADPTNHGRPKREGPALRATILGAYARWLVDNGQKETAKNIVWPIFRNDNKYVLKHWDLPGMNLWSDSNFNGSTFFTTAAQHRAIVEGAQFSPAVGLPCAACDNEAVRSLCRLQEYWNGKEGFVNPGVDKDRLDDLPGRDSSTLLATIHMFEPEAGCDEATFQPCSPQMLSNHKAVVDDFRKWHINKGIPAGKAVAIGARPSGNAWYVTTLAAAEQLYDALITYDRFRSITIIPLSLPFWRDIEPSARLGLYVHSSDNYTKLYKAMRDYADGFLEIVRKYTPADGSFSEQFSQHNGRPLSAQSHSWSHAAFLSAKDRRAKKNIPSPWGAKWTSAFDPEGCSTVPVLTGYPDYKASADFIWPSFSCRPLSQLQLTFNLVADFPLGTKFSVCGSEPSLGSWSKERAPQLDYGRYIHTEDVTVWSSTIEVPAGARIKYRYFITEPTGRQIAGSIKEFGVPYGEAACWYAVSVNDKWHDCESSGDCGDIASVKNLEIV